MSELVLSSTISLSRNLYNSNMLIKQGKWIVKGGENLSKKILELLVLGM